MTSTAIPMPVPRVNTTQYRVLGAVSFCHLLNDMLQALLPAAYPILRGGFNLSFAQIGYLALVYQITASILQPFIGFYTDKHPKPFALPFAMLASGCGLMLLAFASSYAGLMMGAAMLGLGSSIFHPESSRIARLASGGSHGVAQSLFQVGGNIGSALGPLAAAFIVLPQGEKGMAWGGIAAVVGIVIMTALSRWYRDVLRERARNPAHAARAKAAALPALSATQIRNAMIVLVLLLLSKYVYLASFTNFYPFFIMHRFGLSTHDAQLCQFVFFAAVAAGTVMGGPVVDRIGQKKVIAWSILGTLPFTLALPYANLPLTLALSVIIGVVLSSAFPAIIVFAQELVPGRTGMISGMFFGFIFGVSGISAALLGGLADRWGIDAIYQACAFLPVMGVLAWRLPERRKAGG
ncbi:MFS transporter [Amantichitinum ursilacus]|uniref:Fosmidomycin resistance protein n=1 Tax=Amantichitinum ursilacus TaxID=857265 RepID=A0A0N0GM19_9NEIS|nr:MFS transporter [Amantichitinum ursilacus]KPC50684.1 Fosmidomycin resistance protein [Amantichitinum ursilacus]